MTGKNITRMRSYTVNFDKIASNLQKLSIILLLQQSK